MTYPRTETTKYPSTFNFKGVLNSVKQNLNYTDFADSLLDSGFKKPTSGKDAGDHPPITPTTNCPKSLDGASRRLYDFVVRHYLGTLAHNAKFKKTTTTFKIGEEIFTLEGTQIIEPGFKEIMKWVKFSDDQTV